jgi:retron-type reverse transcriptase
VHQSAQLQKFLSAMRCHDAIVAIWTAASGKAAKRLWALDADLQSAFDRLSHDHILASLGGFPARGMVRQWLKAGVVEDGVLSPTEDGAPQGGLCSAEHNEPYGQCRVMRSAGLPGLAGAGSASERCA